MHQVGPLLRELVQDLLLPGISYSVWKTAYFFFELCTHVFSQMSNYKPCAVLLDDEVWMRSVKRVLDDHLSKLARECIRCTSEHIGDIVDALLWNLPEHMTSVTAGRTASESAYAAKIRSHMAAVLQGQEFLAACVVSMAACKCDRISMVRPDAATRNAARSYQPADPCSSASLSRRRHPYSTEQEHRRETPGCDQSPSAEAVQRYEGVHCGGTLALH